MNSIIKRSNIKYLFHCIIFFLVSLFLISFSSIARAHEEPLEAAKLIRSHFPNMEIDRIAKTNIPDVYELTIKDAVVYYHPRTKITFFGELWTFNKVNLTEKRKNELASTKIKDLPLDKAIKIGNGPNIIIEVVDPDCPFCRKTHEYFEKRNDLTRYVFLFPIIEIHPEARKKSQHILCAQDRQQAYKDALSGKLDKNLPEPCDEEAVISLLNQHEQIGKQLNVRGTPALWINNQFVNGANFKQIAFLLDDPS